MRVFSVLLVILARLSSAQFRGPAEPEPVDPNSKVVILSDESFADTVLGELPFFVQFYAPWCGHCRRMGPTWDDLASRLEGQTGIGKVDCTVNPALRDKYKIRGYPTLKLFAHGRVNTFEGQRSIPSFTEFLNIHKGHKTDTVSNVKLTLRSFDWRGDVEPIRLALKELGLKYEDLRYESEEHWEKERQALEASGQAPFGLPALSVDDKLHMSMPSVIARYLARTQELYGKSEEERSLVDSLLADCAEFMQSYKTVVYAPDQDTFEQRKEELDVHAWERYFSKALERSMGLWATDPYTIYFAGAKLSMADLAVFNCLQAMLGLEPRLLQQSRLKDWFVSIGTRDNLSTYLGGSKERPQWMNGPSAQFGNEKFPEDPSSNPFRNH